MVRKFGRVGKGRNILVTFACMTLFYFYFHSAILSFQFPLNWVLLLLQKKSLMKEHLHKSCVVSQREMSL